MNPGDLCGENLRLWPLLSGQKLSTMFLVVGRYGCSFVDYHVHLGGEAYSVRICPMFTWWVECGGVSTHFVEAFSSCQMFSLQPMCRASLGFPRQTFSAGCI